jgi:hypothetical protein
MNVLFLGAAPNAPGAEDNRYPAWLAEIEGTSLLERIVRPLVGERYNLIYCLRAADIRKFHLQKILDAIAPGQTLIAVEGATRGAACTALLATDWIDNDSELLIVSLNEYLEVDLVSAVGDFAARRLDAGTLVFNSLHPRYSYVRLGDDAMVIEAAQGRPISKAATVGAFWFRRGADFVAGAKQMIRKDDHLNGNFYVCPVFNQMILMRRRVGVSWIAPGGYHPLKTEAQIHQFEFDPKAPHD